MLCQPCTLIPLLSADYLPSFPEPILSVILACDFTEKIFLVNVCVTFIKLKWVEATVLSFKEFKLSKAICDISGGRSACVCTLGTAVCSRAVFWCFPLDCWSDVYVALSCFAILDLIFWLPNMEDEGNDVTFLQALESLWHLSWVSHLPLSHLPALTRCLFSHSPEVLHNLEWNLKNWHLSFLCFS